MLERLVEAELTARVIAAGGLCDKVVALGRRGFFDRLVVLPGGRVVFVETKRPRGGRLSANQKALHDAYRSRGCEVRVVRNVEDIEALLGEI
jgi:hypothetical protein